MAALATLADVEALTGDIPTADETRIDDLLDLASAKVRRFTHQTLSAVAGDVLTTRGTLSNELHLGQKPVTAIASITLDGVLVPSTEYRWTASGLVERYVGCWGDPLRVIVVTYSHGYATIPDEIVSVVAELVAAAYSNPDGFRSENIGSYSYTAGEGAAVGFALTDAQKNELKDFGSRATSAKVLPQ